jgi:hypothetical protein
MLHGLNKRPMGDILDFVKVCLSVCVCVCVCVCVLYLGEEGKEGKCVCRCEHVIVLLVFLSLHSH